MILIKGSLQNNSSLVATLATVGNPLYKQNSKMAAKWRHTIWMIFCIHKTVSVIHVIRGFRGHIIHFYWYYVHLTSLEPIFCFLNKMPKIRPDRAPPPQKKKKPKNVTFIEQNDFFDATKSTRSPHFRSFWCSLQSPSLQKILQEAKMFFNSV